MKLNSLFLASALALTGCGGGDATNNQKLALHFNLNEMASVANSALVAVISPSGSGVNVISISPVDKPDAISLSANLSDTKNKYVVLAGFYEKVFSKAEVTLSKNTPTGLAFLTPVKILYAPLSASTELIPYDSSDSHLAFISDFVDQIRIDIDLINTTIDGPLDPVLVPTLPPPSDKLPKGPIGG